MFLSDLPPSPVAAETIVVTGARPRGSVVGDIPPENVLNTRDIRATGATTIAELLDAVAAQTGSARGRDGGRRDGQRDGGLPPAALRKSGRPGGRIRVPGSLRGL